MFVSLFLPSCMNRNKCPWCNQNTLFRRDYHFAPCCGQFYHWGCRVYYTWGLPAHLLLCPNCKAINFNEPYMPTLEAYDNLKSKLWRGECFGGLMVKTLSCGLRDQGSIPARGNFFSHPISHPSFFLATKTPCLQNPTRRSLLLERYCPHLSCCPCPLSMVCANRSNWWSALRSRLRNHLGVPWRILYPQWPKGNPHPLRKQRVRSSRYDETSNWTTHVHLVIERTPIMFYYALKNNKIVNNCSPSLFSSLRR